MLLELCTENAHRKVVGQFQLETDPKRQNCYFVCACELLDFWHKTPQANKQSNNALDQSLSYLFIFSLNELLIYTSTSKCTRKGAR